MMQTTLTPDLSPELSIVVISYNTADMTVAALKSVFDTAGDITFELLVCDNESRDGSVEAIEAAFPQELGKRLILVRSGGNLGFARANNVMARQARGRRILLLNPDTVVLPNALQNLLAFAAKTPDARIWGGRTYLGDGTLDPASVWGKLSLRSLFFYTFGIQKLFPNSAFFNPEGYGGWDRLTEREVDIVTGCYLLIDTDLWRTLGGFDRRFFMYAEEADLCLRARAHGARPRFTPTSEIVHFGGASEQLQSAKLAKLFAGKLTLVEKHLPAWQLPVARGLFATAVCGRSIALRGLGAVTGRERWRRSGQEWAAVWERRDDWLHGYPEPPAEGAD